MNARWVNGQVGSVHGPYDSTIGRYRVEVLSKSGTKKIVKLKPSNLCSTFQEDELRSNWLEKFCSWNQSLTKSRRLFFSDSSYSTHRIKPNPSDFHGFVVGDHVQVRGIMSKRELNGSVGVVYGWQTSIKAGHTTMHFKIRLDECGGLHGGGTATRSTIDDQATFALKPGNLVLLPLSAVPEVPELFEIGTSVVIVDHPIGYDFRNSCSDLIGHSGKVVESLRDHLVKVRIDCAFDKEVTFLPHCIRAVSRRDAKVVAYDVSSHTHLCVFKDASKGRSAAWFDLSRSVWRDWAMFPRERRFTMSRRKIYAFLSAWMRFAKGAPLDDAVRDIIVPFVAYNDDRLLPTGAKEEADRYGALSVEEKMGECVAS
jgi:hypothetical protein